MDDESPNLPVRSRVPLSEMLEKIDQMGPSVKWICGDLALRLAARGIRDKDGRSFVGHPDDPPVFPPDEK